MIIHCVINLSSHDIHLPFLYPAYYTSVFLREPFKKGRNSNKIKRAFKCDLRGGGKMGSEDDLISYSPRIFLVWKSGRLTDPPNQLRRDQ